MAADIQTLHKLLKARLTQYEHAHRKKPSTSAIARMLSTTLYSRRFFPYYTFNVLGGVDEQGNGIVYSYDAIGSMELSPYSSSGSARELVQPLLDNQIGWKGQKETLKKPLRTKEDVVDLIKDAMTSATERDIYTGDYVDIYVISADQAVQTEKFELKFD
eukprot:CAMPEP_0201552442 /NCGR_PEP_ID=MMETSP0173_2-20130828/16408_1 /ASSEMBLY_ACC=CAM_ASM_000268 /TAXON_ID=218659 /ORGANISM="Vexillifera sp., Strain DIVA3 564/2" /LENGTH=159 /DNA_ID=CAMNT_0047962931 /DNA_START=177 /DNA_END=656 /DNA_ORIENTATION=+